jgi:prepilin-type N-terminal cleavage/methylation domain-containing protein
MRASPIRSGGFTLIEVVGALVIFSVGVLLTLSLTDTISDQVERAAVRSEMVARAHTALDSLQAEGFPVLTPASRTGNLTFRGRQYRETVRVSLFSPLVLELSVSLEPTSGRGPRHSVTSFVSGTWRP